MKVFVRYLEKESFFVVVHFEPFYQEIHDSQRHSLDQICLFTRTYPHSLIPALKTHTHTTYHIPHVHAHTIHCTHARTHTPKYFVLPPSYPTYLHHVNSVQSTAQRWTKITILNASKSGQFLQNWFWSSFKICWDKMPKKLLHIHLKTCKYKVKNVCGG